MRTVRRLLQVVALAGTLLVGVVALALIVSQTPWFRDWLRRYIVRESKQYLNGEVTIGRLGGNLFFGVQLADVAVDVSGERVVAVKGVDLDYSIFTLISEGIVLDRIRLVEPKLRLERDRQGWNVGRLVKEQKKEAEREGPARPALLRSIEIDGGTLEIAEDDGENGGSPAVELPTRIEDLDVRAAFAYEPVRYRIDLDRASFTSTAPDVELHQLSGRIDVRDDDIHLDEVVMRLGDSTIAMDGAIEQYLKTPVIKLTTTGKVSLPEIGRVLPAVADYPLHPDFEIEASGPAESLALDLNVRSEAGNVKGQVTADVKSPDFGVEGELDVARLNLAPLLKNPSQRSSITGRAAVDLVMASAPSEAPMLDRMSGRVRFSGPAVAAAGYEATDVHATGSLQRGRINLHARAAAYGGTATAAGFVAPGSKGRPLAFDLQGSAANVSLKNLPAATGAPGLDTTLSIAEYRVAGSGRAINGSARFNRSEVEGATIAEGTVAEFGSKNGQVTYAARGGIEDLDLRRLGGALRVQALDKPEFASAITGTFDVRGAGTRIETMTLDASGTLTDASFMGARLHDLKFETRLAEAGLDATLQGSFAGLDPARVTRQPRLQGSVTGTIDATVRVADLTQPVTPDAVTASGRMDLSSSQVGGLDIDKASIQGDYAGRIGDLTRFTLEGPDLRVDANGRLSLDRSTQSKLMYHVEATDLAAMGRLAGQTGFDGSAILDGTLTGNAGSMRTSGRLDSSNLMYQGHTALDLNSKYDVTVPELAFVDATVQATTTATFVKAAGLELDAVEATTTYTKKTLDFSARMQEQTRELEASGRVIFHPDHQEIHLPSFTVRTQGQSWSSSPGTEAAIEYGGGTLGLENVSLANGDQTLTVEGTLALEGEQPSGALKVRAGNVDLAQLEQLLLVERGLAGRLTADALVGGTMKAPTVDGHVEVVNGGFRAYRYESLSADVKYADQRLDLDARLQQSAAEIVTARGTLPMSLFSRSGEEHAVPTERDRVDVHITSTHIGLGLVQGFTTFVTNVTGTMQADVRLTGSGADPHIVGWVDIKNGAFGVPLGGTSYSGLHTRIELKPDVVTIQGFQLSDEHGQPLMVSGQLAVHARDVGAVDIGVQSDNFEVIDNELGDLGLDSNLQITGELRRPRIQGQVRVEAGRIEVDRMLQLFYDPYSVTAIQPVMSAERTIEGTGGAEEATRQALARALGTAAAPGAAAPAGEEQAGGAFSPVALDVRLLIPDNLVLRGRELRPGGPTRAAIGDLNITVGGDVQVRKAPGGPVTLTGVVQTVRGTYEFRNRRFDLVRGGTLRFTGEPTINPLLDVSATREIPDTGVEARIRIRGTVRKPELQLSSTPPLEESDILSLIVFNRPVNELGTGERTMLAETAGGIATGFVAAPLGESIGRALDLDLFEITTTTETGELGAGIIIGQQIGDRAFFRLRQQFGDQNVSEFLIEYQLADFLRVRASAAPETSGAANRIGQRRVERAGIDLIFFFSY